MMLTYLAVTIISIRANVNQALASFQGHMKDMIAYMRRENIPEDLQRYDYFFKFYKFCLLVLRLLVVRDFTSKKS